MKYIKVKVHAQSRENKILQKSADSFEVWTKEKAENNKANRSVIEILSHYLNVNSSKLIIRKGHKNPSKIIEIY
jgi:uncharacterized protein YggU (UPF0235/DUF167 family)